MRLLAILMLLASAAFGQWGEISDNRAAYSVQANPNPVNLHIPGLQPPLPFVPGASYGIQVFIKAVAPTQADAFLVTIRYRDQGKVWSLSKIVDRWPNGTAVTIINTGPDAQPISASVSNIRYTPVEVQ